MKALPIYSEKIQTVIYDQRGEELYVHFNTHDSDEYAWKIYLNVRPQQVIAMCRSGSAEDYIMEVIEAEHVADHMNVAVYEHYYGEVVREAIAYDMRPRPAIDLPALSQNNEATVCLLAFPAWF